MKKSLQIILEILLAAACVFLAIAIVKSINKPVNFNKQKAYRESVAIQRLKDIRTLQVAYKSVTGRFTSTVDSLKDFYNNGKMSIIMQVGSMDDSLAVAHTEAVKRSMRGKKVTPEMLQELYLKGDHNLVYTIESKIPVKDTLFNDRPDINLDDLKYIPFSDGELVEMEAVTKMVSGVPVPLFEARMPYKALLKGLDNQLRINLDADQRDKNRYEGLQVGSISAPNNNAGNWE
ncbi:MAG: hypothetical protein IK030_03825 [Bacteroidales bacterium]|nr:hypothetical protein [Bacteroidales bacterium]